MRYPRGMAMPAREMMVQGEVVQEEVVVEVEIRVGLLVATLT